VPTSQPEPLGLTQQFPRVLAQGFKHAVAGATGVFGRQDHRSVDEAPQQLGHVSAVAVVASTHRFRRVEREPAREDRYASERLPFLVRQQL
jgi:hypothetical protein